MATLHSSGREWKRNRHSGRDKRRETKFIGVRRECVNRERKHVICIAPIAFWARTERCQPMVFTPFFVVSRRFTIIHTYHCSIKVWLGSHVTLYAMVRTHCVDWGPVGPMRETSPPVCNLFHLFCYLMQCNLDASGCSRATQSNQWAAVFKWILLCSVHLCLASLRRAERTRWLFEKLMHAHRRHCQRMEAKYFNPLQFLLLAAHALSRRHWDDRLNLFTAIRLGFLSLSLWFIVVLLCKQKVWPIQFIRYSLTPNNWSGWSSLKIAFVWRASTRATIR